MNVNKITLSASNNHREMVPAQEFILLKVDRSEQLIVFRVPKNAGEYAEAGAKIVFTTDEGKQYEGFIEVVADATDSRIYWCGVSFEPITLYG